LAVTDVGFAPSSSTSMATGMSPKAVVMFTLGVGVGSGVGVTP